MTTTETAVTTTGEVMTVIATAAMTGEMIVAAAMTAAVTKEGARAQQSDVRRLRRGTR